MSWFWCRTVLRHLKLNSDGWLTTIRIHGRMLYSVKIPISKYSWLPHPVLRLATVGSRLARLHTAPVQQMHLYTAYVKDPIGLFSRLKFTAPDRVRPRLQTVSCERSLNLLKSPLTSSGHIRMPVTNLTICQKAFLKSLPSKHFTCYCCFLSHWGSIYGLDDVFRATAAQRWDQQGHSVPKERKKKWHEEEKAPNKIS